MSNKSQIVTIIIAAFLLVSVPPFIQSVNWRESQVQACERGNETIRNPLFAFITTAEKTRRTQAELTSGAEKEANLKAAEEYAEEAENMVVVPLEQGLLLEPGKPAINCEKAYPKPFPLNIFD